MRRALFFGLLFLLIMAGVVSGKDGIISFYLSRASGAYARVSGVHMPQMGQIAFSGLTASGVKEGPEWFRAEKGIIFIPLRGDFAGGLRVRLENMTLGEALQKSSASFSSWIKRGDRSLPVIEKMDLSIRNSGGALRVRIFKARGRRFHFSGGAHIRARRAEKLNARLVISDKDNSRAFGLVFGGTTWTLRGSRGPLLQFSGDIL